jgi:hypothetical protein
MARVHGSSDYRAPIGNGPEGVADALVDTTQQVGERAREAGDDIAAAVQRRPYATMAIAGGLALAIGGLWMLRTQRPQSQLDALLARLPDLPDRKSLLAHRWRS